MFAILGGHGLRPVSAANRGRVEERTYRVFISYKHSDPTTHGSDGEFARWLQRRLETYSFPRKLVGMGTSVGVVPARIGLVFRDEDYLPAGPELDLLIEQALRSSENLVVLCSPAAAASPWVDKEIAFFKSLQVQAANGRGTRRQVFGLIVDGEPHASDTRLECFPPALRVQVDAGKHLTTVPSNPLAPDIRRDGRDNAVLRLIAGLFGLDFEDLIAREEQRRRDFRRRSILVLALGIILSAAALAGLAGTALLGWRNALARSDLIAADAGQLMLDNRTEEGLLISLSATPPPGGGVLPLRPAAQRAIATAVVATENLEAVLQSSGLEVRVVKPFHKSPIVLAAGMDGTANIFDIHSGKTLRVLRESGEPIRMGAVSIDDKLVAVAPTSGPVVVWPTEGGGPPVELAFGDDEPTAIQFSPDGRWLVVASEKSVKTWRIGDWSNVHILENGGTAMAVSADSSKLVVGNGEGAVAAYAIKGDLPLWRKQVHEGPITALAFASDGTRLITASLDGTAKLIDAATGDELGKPMRSSGPTLAAAFSPDGELVATTTPDGVVELYDGKNGSERLSYPTNAGWTAAIAFSADGKTLAVGSRNRTITVISTPDAKSSLVLRGHQGEVLALSFTSEGGELVSGGSDGSIRVWSTVDRRKRCEVSLGGLEGRSIALAISANTAAIQGRDGTIGIFHLSDCTGVSVLNTRSETVSNFAISPDGSEIALLKSDGWEVRDTASGAAVDEAKIEPAGAVALSRTALAVASGSKILVWALSATQQQPVSIKLPQEIRQIAFSSDGQLIGAALADATFVVVRPEGSVIGRHPGGLADVKWIEFSSRGDQALMGNDDGVAMLIRGLVDNTAAELLASDVSTAQFLSDNAIVYLTFKGIAHALDTKTLDQLYTYPAVSQTSAASAISAHRSLVSLSAFGNDMIVRDLLPVGLPLVGYGCQVRPIGSERVLSAQSFRELSVSLGDLLPCDTSSTVEQIIRLVTFAIEGGH